jgi:hypothetical protein
MPKLAQSGQKKVATSEQSVEGEDYINILIPD